MNMLVMGFMVFFADASEASSPSHFINLEDQESSLLHWNKRSVNMGKIYTVIEMALWDLKDQ